MEIREEFLWGYAEKLEEDAATALASGVAVGVVVLVPFEQPANMKAHNIIATILFNFFIFFFLHSPL